MNAPSRTLPRPTLQKSATINSVNEENRTDEMIFSIADRIEQWAVHNGVAGSMLTLDKMTMKSSKHDALKPGGLALDVRRVLCSQPIVLQMAELKSRLPRRMPSLRGSRRM